MLYFVSVNSLFCIRQLLYCSLIHTWTTQDPQHWANTARGRSSMSEKWFMCDKGKKKKKEDRGEVKMMKFVLDGSRYKEVNICTKPQHWNNEINSDFLYQNGPHSSDCLLKTELQQGLCKSSRLVLDWTHPWIPLLERKLTLRKLKKK